MYTITINQNTINKADTPVFSIILTPVSILLSPVSCIILTPYSYLLSPQIIKHK